jgi:predicted secreted Zn-dependent protease
MSLPRRRLALFGASMLLWALPGTLFADPVISKSYSYFSIGGRTAEDLDSELERRGPLTRATGFRHPGATEIRFGGEVTYLESEGKCAIGAAKVTLKTRIILPRWTNRKRAPDTLALIWDTLSADIKRHEERHAEIARTHARRLERALLDMSSSRSCAVMEQRVGEITQKMIEAHDTEQVRFDMVESKNFDARMMRLLKYRTGATD